MNSMIEAVDPLLEYAVAIVAFTGRLPLRRMLAKLPLSTKVIVIDNSADSEDISDLIRERPKTTYINSGGNIGFGAACNLAASVASEPFIAFVNPDAEVDAAVLDSLVREIAPIPVAVPVVPFWSITTDRSALDRAAGCPLPGGVAACPTRSSSLRVVPRVDPGRLREQNGPNGARPNNRRSRFGGRASPRLSL